MIPPRSRAGAALLCGAAAVAIAYWPALAQRAPESLLPPGFGEPVTAPAPPPTEPGAPPPSASPPPGGPVSLLPPDMVPPPPAPETPEEAAADQRKAADIELPPAARRSLDRVGMVSPPYGMAANAFGAADGRFLNVLMHRLDAPIASRWASILLRRALLSQVDSPRAAAPVDWVAERAWLLLRMGEADAARMLVQSVDVGNYNRNLYQVATQTSLATADPAGLCPLVAGAQTQSNEPVWPLADAMCAALSGEPSVAGALIDRARQKRTARGIDLLLAEKVVGAGANGRRSITIEWDGVDKLTAWRYGLATALAVEIPAPLFATVGPQVQAWRARAAIVPAAQRVAPARVAAALGVFSNAALVDLYAGVYDATDVTEVAASDAGRLRAAYVGTDDEARMTALRDLWRAARGERDRYAAAILTARAASRIAPDTAFAGDAAALVGAMFSAGLDTQATRWAGIVEDMGKAGDAAWAILAVGSPRPAVSLDAGRIDAFRKRAGESGAHKSRLLVAALTGLGRIAARDQEALAKAVDLRIGVEDNWTRAIDAAARARQPGTVALLCAVGMQTATWRGVPPHYFYHMIAGLRAVGLEGEARMIAAEAMTRL
ncbi:MAG TPA: hypothetical protein VNQ31_07345 [Sphingomonadaceae bacterium]|nr:hypothetical protein [Sphingomonadaceae bacterium]